MGGKMAMVTHFWELSQSSDRLHGALMAREPGSIILSRVQGLAWQQQCNLAKYAVTI